jgi:hypothetical protein
MLNDGFVLRWKLQRSTREAEGITAISRWSSEANTTGSQPPSGRTPAGVPHLFEQEVQSVGVGLPERRGQAKIAICALNVAGTLLARRLTPKLPENGTVRVKLMLPQKQRSPKKSGRCELSRTSRFVEQGFT